jgi:hypothetical protein
LENLGIFYDYLVYFTAIGNILFPFGIFYGNLVYFSRFGILDQEKSGNPVPFFLRHFSSSPHFMHLAGGHQDFYGIVFCKNMKADS